MPKASDLSPDFRFFGLFVGESGSGKTVAECSFPKDIQVEDFDGRIRGLLGAPWVKRDGIEYNTYPPRLKNASGDPNYIKLNNNLTFLQNMVEQGRSKVQTIVLDSLTSETYALICDAKPHTHEQGKGKKIGQLDMSGPEDYGFEAQGTYDILTGLRSIKVPNVIISAHMIDRYAKEDPDNPFSASVPVGKKLSVRDKIGENVKIYFDHIFEFYRRTNRFFVKFRGELARTSYAGLPDGEVEITGKDFYKVMMSYVSKEDLIKTAETHSKEGILK